MDDDKQYLEARAQRAPVVHESELQRQHPRVRLPGRFRSGRREYPLHDVSAGGFAFDPQQEHFTLEQCCRGELLFQLDTLALKLPVQVQVRHASNERVGVAFLEMAPREIAALRELINATLAGELVGTGELIRAVSRDTMLPARALPADAGALNGGARARALLATLMMAVVGLVAAVYALSKIYALAFVTQASAAKVAAHSVALSMPRDGTFFGLVPEQGTVKKGQPLASFQGAMLDVVQTDLGALHLSPEQLSQLMGEQLKGTLSSPCDCKVQQQFAVDGQYVNRGQPLFELVPLDGKPYVLARFRFENLDELREGRTVAFQVSGDARQRYGRIREVHLLSQNPTDAAAGDLRGLSNAGAVAEVIVSIEPQQALPAALVNRPAQVQLDGQFGAWQATAASVLARARRWLGLA